MPCISGYLRPASRAGQASLPKLHPYRRPGPASDIRHFRAGCPPRYLALPGCVKRAVSRDGRGRHTATTVCLESQTDKLSGVDAAHKITTAATPALCVGSNALGVPETFIGRRNPGNMYSARSSMRDFIGFFKPNCRRFFSVDFVRLFLSADSIADSLHIFTNPMLALQKVQASVARPRRSCTAKRPNRLLPL